MMRRVGRMGKKHDETGADKTLDVPLLDTTRWKRHPSGNWRRQRRRRLGKQRSNPGRCQRHLALPPARSPLFEFRPRWTLQPRFS